MACYICVLCLSIIYISCQNFIRKDSNSDQLSVISLLALRFIFIPYLKSFWTAVSIVVEKLIITIKAMPLLIGPCRF